MEYIATAAEAKEIDQFSINEIGIPSCVLMERAALQLTSCIEKRAAKKKDSILVVCGMGNNGGDGVAAARMLYEKGYRVTLLYIGNKEKASEEMKTQITIAEKIGILEGTKESLSEYTIIVDAIFGIGLTREVKGEYAEWIAWINAQNAYVISVDIPSGIDATTGKVWGIAVKADDTVTFGVNKRGLLLFPGASYAGNVSVAEIGFPKQAIEHTLPEMITYTKEDIALQYPKRLPDTNKGSFGKVLVIAGSSKISGACYFAAEAALRTGCGLVKIITHENNRTALQVRLPESMLITYQSETKEEYQKLQDDLEKELQTAAAVLIGPGLSKSGLAALLLKRILQVRNLPVVIDADGINLLSSMEEYFTEDNRVTLTDNFILTPHVKEMSRLIKMPVDEIKKDIVNTARNHTEGATIVLKDARSVVTNGQKLYLNLSGNNALAKGGSGDALSGIIAGLVSQKTEPFTAGSLGAYLHGLTAERYTKKKGKSTMLARDILKELQKILP